MIESSSNFELRVSPKPVIATLAVLGWVFGLLNDYLPDPSKAMDFVLLLFTLLAALWLLANRKPYVGRWFTIAVLIGMVYLGSSWLGVPGLLTLMVIPTALAAPLLGLPAAAATALGETVLLLLLRRTVAAGVDSATLGAALIGIWAVLGVMSAAYLPVYRLSGWLWEYFERSQSDLEEARDRKAELVQTLDDLAHANRQLALGNERLAALRQIAEQAQKTKAAFVAKVSHEFRTPLNMIIGLVGLMVDDPEVYHRELPPAVRQDLKIVHRNCEHLSSMVNDVLALSQAEAGRLTLHRERVDLAEVIDRALAVVRPLLEKKNLSVQVIVPDDLPEVYCDRTRIRQVILNLVSNAARFTEEGDITIRAVEQDQQVVISVADTGPGIPPEDTESIFEPFYQSATSLWRDKGGSGLGLSVSKQFVELHNGRIWLESEMGVGTTFFFGLPISPPMAPLAKPGHWIKDDWIWVERTSRPRLPDSHYKPRVVVCDETGDLYPALTPYSDEVELVDTRNLAQVVRELQQSPAHAVVFNTASQGDLWPLLEKARREMQDTPIIGCCVPRQLERALRAHAVDYLVKPVSRGDLEEAIQRGGSPVKRVLIVDDDPQVLHLWGRMLQARDDTLEVTTASSGEQALEELRSQSLDLVLLDVVMPNMDGWQMMAIKDQDKTIRDVPVILVSARDPTEQPLASQAMLVTMGHGLSLSKILRCSLGISALLLQPD